MKNSLLSALIILSTLGLVVSSVIVWLFVVMKIAEIIFTILPVGILFFIELLVVSILVLVISAAFAE